MPKSPRRTYLIRDVASGKMLGNAEGYTAKGALTRFLVDHALEDDAVVDIKARTEPDLPEEDWVRFSVS